MGRKKGPQATELGLRFGENLLEHGRRVPRLDTIVKLAGAVEVEPCALLTGLAWELDPPKERSK
jgi:hypothetical protein